jgi:hypothetical protein
MVVSPPQESSWLRIRISNWILPGNKNFKVNIKSWSWTLRVLWEKSLILFVFNWDLKWPLRLGCLGKSDETARCSDGYLHADQRRLTNCTDRKSQQQQQKKKKYRLRYVHAARRRNPWGERRKVSEWTNQNEQIFAMAFLHCPSESLRIPPSITLSDIKMENSIVTGLNWEGRSDKMSFFSVFPDSPEVCRPLPSDPIDAHPGLPPPTMSPPSWEVIQ